MKSFAGKVLLITCGPPESGQATAIAFAETEQGANVVIAGGRHKIEGAESVVLVERGWRLSRRLSLARSNTSVS